MAPLRKSALLKLFEASVRASGWSLLHLTDPNEHPAGYQIYSGDAGWRVRVYIWNLTPGGRVALPDEWRIQVTGLPEPAGSQQFFPEVGGKTLILGWWSDLDVFAGFDVSYHLGPLGKSASLQIRQGALESAHINGMAHYFRGHQEIAFAIKPEFMGAYLSNMEELHACGSSEEAMKLFEQVCENPETVDEQDIIDQVPEARRYAVVATKKALRDAKFKDRVLTAYSHTCAMCGVQLRLLDAAHILPAAHPDSTDETSNGIALCALHHRAFDRGFVTFDTGYRTHRNREMEDELEASGLDGGLKGFLEALSPVIHLPPDQKDRPHAVYVERVNAMRGWHL